MQTHTRLLRLAAVFFILHTSFFIGRAAAQRLSPPDIDSGQPAAAPIPATATAATDDDDNTGDEIVELSVFNVTGAKDDGYTAMNTASGSRIATPLKDVAASISAFTEEFLNDIGATSIEDILNYATNVEMDFEDSDRGFNDTASRGTGGSPYRIRGLDATTVVDYVNTSVPSSAFPGYNRDRVEIASGANSILFGMAKPGGIVNITTKRAQAQRNHLKIRSEIGTWTGTPNTGLPYKAVSLDYNIVLMPKTLGLRLMSLYEDGSSKSWRAHQGSPDKRINPALFMRPFKNTSINIKYQAGKTQEQTGFSQINLEDQITAWTAAEKPMSAKTAGAANGAAPFPSLTGGRSAGGNNANYVFVTGNPLGLAPAVYDFRATYQTVSSFPKPTSDMPTRLPASLSSYYYNPAGPSSIRNKKFDDASITIEQEVGNLNFELGCYHNKCDTVFNTPQGNAVQLMGDPNEYISAVYDQAWGSNTPPLIANPYARGMYVDNAWMRKSSTITNDIVRLTSTCNLNLRKFGRHRIINTLEYSKNITRSLNGVEVLVDENQRTVKPFVPAADPAANIDQMSDSANWVYRRQYVTPGDFSTYYCGDWRTPLPKLVFGGHEWHSTIAANGANQAKHNETTTRSAMIAIQSLLFKDRLSTILGVRFDEQKSMLENTSLITNPNDPRLLNKTKAYGEYALNGTYERIAPYRPVTFSVGGVYHVTDWLSLAGNYSNNRNAPGVGSMVITGPAPLMEGRTFDYGIRLAFGRNMVLTIKRFDTSQLYDPTIQSQETGGNNNLYNIQEALRAACTPEQLAEHGVSFLAFDANKSRYKNLMVDYNTRGFEAELTGNITKNLSVRASFSYSDKEKTNMFQEIRDYFDANIKNWMAAATAHDQSAASNGVVYFYNFRGKQVGLSTSNESSYTIPLVDYIRAQLWMPGDNSVGDGPLLGAPYNDNNGDTSVKQGLINEYVRQEGTFGSRPYKARITLTYKFPKGPLKGFAVGGGVRYDSPNIMPIPVEGKGDTSWTMPPSDCETLDVDKWLSGHAPTIKGNTLLFWDAMVRYKCKIFKGRTNLTLQLNVKNVFDQCVVTTGRTSTWGGVVSKVYLNPPRTFRLTATLDF